MDEKNVKEKKIGRKSFNAGTLLAPLPAALVTVGDMENSGVLTIAWCGILSSTPPRAYVSVRPSRYSHKLLTESGEFVINLTSEELAFATDYAGIYTGAKVDKFEKLSLTKVESKEVKAPTIAQSPLSLECRVFEVISMGTHDVFMADILSVSAREDIIDEKDKIRYDKAKLIAYSHGEYFALGKAIGKFGFSTDRANKKGRGKPASRGESKNKGRRENAAAKDKGKAANPKGRVKFKGDKGGVVSK